MQWSRVIVRLFLIAVAAAPSALWFPVSGLRYGKQDKAVTTGTWGGEHVIFEVSEKGADVEFDCARGQISQPIALNQRGDFDVLGTYSPEHGGPVRRDEPVTSTPARYSGHVLGDTMTVTVTQGKEKVGTFTLTRGARPVLRKCR
jgi:hypothetical protein